ncbi:hypothetical protein CLV45_3076 [Hymenobacter chitinivorans DSM 11115]|uniref:Uncharacterized protein n=1 Tax=Hymenobacter chitinivorans DSM 11115 TaxID=1121954 RepID=A0A2M9B9W0_9BACT|nr:hypothetical protein CLV45_3076 [Hymenobacter chitinivorans DSM 11115]
MTGKQMKDKPKAKKLHVAANIPAPAPPAQHAGTVCQFRLFPRCFPWCYIRAGALS